MNSSRGLLITDGMRNAEYFVKHYLRKLFRDGLSIQIRWDIRKSKRELQAVLKPCSELAVNRPKNRI